MVSYLPLLALQRQSVRERSEGPDGGLALAPGRYHRRNNPKMNSLEPLSSPRGPTEFRDE